MVDRRPRPRWPYLLLIVPCAAVLYPPFFAHIKPAFSGIPFFVWYQLMWTVLAAGVIGLVYLLTRDPEDDVQPPRHESEELTPP